MRAPAQFSAGAASALRNVSKNTRAEMLRTGEDIVYIYSELCLR